MNIHEEDVFQLDEQGNPADFIPSSMQNLITSDNENNFLIIETMVEGGLPLHLKFGVAHGLPYYEIQREKPVKLYLNKEIVRYIHDWLKDGRVGNRRIDFFTIRPASDNYIFYLIRNDRVQGATRYNKVTQEYSAFYPHGKIEYGKLPYTPEELVAKLETLP